MLLSLWKCVCECAREWEVSGQTRRRKQESLCFSHMTNFPLVHAQMICLTCFFFSHLLVCCLNILGECGKGNLQVETAQQSRSWSLHLRFIVFSHVTLLFYCWFVEHASRHHLLVACVQWHLHGEWGEINCTSRDETTQDKTSAEVNMFVIDSHSECNSRNHALKGKLSWLPQHT